MHTLLPEPVAPAINVCGILLKSPTTHFPEISLPNANANFLLDSINSLFSNTSLKNTGVCFPFGTSIPTAAFPGIGASILIPDAAKPKAISSDKFTILLTLTPGLGCNSNLVTDGPLVTCVTLASTPKLDSISSSLFAFSINSFLSELFNLVFEFNFKSSKLGCLYSFSSLTSESFSSISLFITSLTLLSNFSFFLVWSSLTLSKKLSI